LLRRIVLPVAKGSVWEAELAPARAFSGKKKGEQSSPNVSLKHLAGGSKLWVGFQTTL